MSKLKGLAQNGLNYEQENILSSKELIVSAEINQANSTALESSSEHNRLIPPTEPSQQIPPTDPGDDPVLTPPTDPSLISEAANNFDGEQDLIPPTDPGDELSMIPPTDPGDDLIMVPASNDSEGFTLTPPITLVEPETDHSGSNIDDHFASVANGRSRINSNMDQQAGSKSDSQYPGKTDFVSLIPPTEPKLQKQSDATETSASSSNQAAEKTWLNTFRQESIIPLKAFLKGKYGTLFIVFGIVFSYALTTGQSSQAMVSISDAIQWGANFSPKTTGSDFEWWRLLISTFLHWDLSHITFNLGAFLLLALQIEHLLGTTALLCLFVTSSAFAGTATLMFYPNQVSMGASGGIYGIFGALLVLFILTRGQRVKFAKSITFFMVIWLFYSLISNTDSSQVDHASHFGGILSGFVLGIFFAPLYKHQKQKIRTRLIYHLLPLCFTVVTIRMAWSLLPMPHPIFELIEQYSVKAQILHKHVQRFHTLEPLQQRVLWDTKIRPLLQTLEAKLIDSTKQEALVTRNEIKSVTHATQWTLKRLLNVWWAKFGHEFEAIPKSIKIKHKEALPFEVIQDLYESMLNQHQSAQLIEPTWDERMKAVEYYESWRHLKEARQYLSQICAELVNEASSAKVRAQGSLWAQAEVRHKRLQLIANTLKQRSSLNSTDVVTLTQIKWLKAQVEKVIRVSSFELRKPKDRQILTKEDRVKLTKLLYQAVLAAPPTELGSELEFRLTAKGKLLVSKGYIPRQGQLFLSARQCEKSAKGMIEDQNKSQSKEINKVIKPKPQLQRFIIEVLPPLEPISDHQADSLNYLSRDFTDTHQPMDSIKSGSRPKCLEEIKVLTWFNSDERFKHHAIWIAHPLDH